MMYVADLFSGVGGFSLGLEWTKEFKTVLFCENDKSCHKVLKKHWPDIPIYDDIKKVTIEKIKKDKIPKIDIVTGGFPCQDISQAGKGKGIKASRSGLWSEMCRLISEIRPKYAIVENVQALLHRGLESVLGDLAEIGYDAEWHCIPASAIGAPHQRDRIWIIAYSSSQQRTWKTISKTNRCNTRKKISHSNSKRFTRKKNNRNNKDMDNERPTLLCDERWWRIESKLGRVAHGISNRMVRLRQLGNSVVPQIPYLIGMSILEKEKT